MATIYEVKIKLVSEFCNYSESELTEILAATIDLRNSQKNVKEHGKELKINNINIKRVG